MSDTTPAWLLRVADDIQFSVGEHQALEYIESPHLHQVPMAPDYCKSVIFWQSQIVPVVDMNVIYEKPATPHVQHIMIIAYQKTDNVPLDYVAFILSAAPEKIEVNDDDFTELPEIYPERLKPYVLSAFNHQNTVTSIFDITSINTTGF